MEITQLAIYKREVNWCFWDLCFVIKSLFFYFSIHPTSWKSRPVSSPKDREWKER